MGGRGSKSGLAAAGAYQTITAPPPQPQITLQAAPLVPPQPDDQQPVPQMPQPPQVDASGFSDTDAADFHDLYGGRAYYQRQNLDVDTRLALQDYLDPNTTPGSQYNFSQNMNYAITQGYKLDAQQQFAYDSIVGSSHNLGYNINLTRYDHGEYLDSKLASLGITGGHTGMSVQQLKQVLVGQTYQDARILSASYNNFKNAADPSTFTTREVKITYRAKASTQGLMPGTGPGGDLGEMLLAPSGTNGHNNYKIVDVKMSGAKARPKGGSTSYLPLKQIEVVVEVG